VPAYVSYVNKSFTYTLKKLFPRGFSANFVLLIWSVFGGVLLHGLLANFLTMLVKPMMEEPVDTAQDILDRGLIPFIETQMVSHIRLLKESPNPAYRQLSEIVVTPTRIKRINQSDWSMGWTESGPNSAWNLTLHGIQGNGTHVMLTNILLPHYEALGDWHYSKELLSGELSWFNWHLNKKWHLTEELTKHMLMYHQVCTIWFTVIFIRHFKTFGNLNMV
jgi:hypothetical protein